MSYGFEFHAPTPAAAIDHMKSTEVRAPSTVKNHIIAVLANTKHDGPVRVSGQGHAPERPGDYDHTNVHFEIHPFHFIGHHDEEWHRMHRDPYFREPVPVGLPHSGSGQSGVDGTGSGR